MWLVVVLLVLCVSACSPRITGDSVTLLKCCPQGLVLSQNNSCKQGSNSNSWPPPVYSPSASGFLPDLPRHWRLLEDVRPSCGPCGQTTLWSNAASPRFVLFENGSLLLDFRKFYPPGSFCVEGAAAIVCSEENCEAPSGRVRKCCGDEAVFSDERQHCVPMVNFTALSVPTSGLGFPVCGDLVAAGTLNQDVQMGQNGSLLLPGTDTSLSPEQFCLEHILENPSSTATIFTCAELLPAKSSPKWDLRFTLYPIGLFVSVLFLAATLVAGCVLPTSHHMLHWKCQTGHVTCLLVGDLILATTQLAGSKLSGGACVVMAVIMHYFFLAAFFWLNTMCFNIWWTFRDLRPASLDKGQEAFRLKLYQIYAWGGPLLIAGVGAIVDRLPEDSYKLLRPRFGQQRCWFYGDVEIFPYFYGPVGVLLVINLVLFMATAHELTCGLWKREVVKSNTERATLGRVCLKLVVVMGLTWVADVVSWAVGGPHYLWYVTDLINALQGLFIFLVAGCQPQVWSAVKRMWCLRPQRAQGANMEHHLSLYSQGDSVTNNHSTKTGQLETLC